MDAVDIYLSDIFNSMTRLEHDTILDIANMIDTVDKESQGRIYVIGNGGSATTASHISGDLFKTCGFDSMCLCDSNYLITALANDEGYEYVFSKQLYNVMTEDDLLIAISGSGRSPNIIEAIMTAKKFGVKVIGLTGFDGGIMKDICDICLIVDNNCMEQIEDIHLMIGHCLVTILKGVNA